MDCQKTQRLLDDLAAQRLRRRVAREVQQHLAACTDCRVASQRAAKLQRLLALKRYESPGSAYFDQVTAEFHRRLQLQWQHASRWERWLETVRQQLVVEPRRLWRYGFAGSVGLAVAGLLLWVSEQPTETVVLPAESVSPVLVAVQQTAPPAPVLPEPSPVVRMSVRPPTHIAGPAAVASYESPPRYVLDRVRVTPVNYEAAAVHF